MATSYTDRDRNLLEALLRKMEYPVFWDLYRHDIRVLGKAPSAKIRVGPQLIWPCNSDGSVVNASTRQSISYSSAIFATASKLVDRIIPALRHKLPIDTVGGVLATDPIATAKDVREILGAVVALKTDNSQDDFGWLTGEVSTLTELTGIAVMPTDLGKFFERLMAVVDNKAEASNTARGIGAVSSTGQVEASERGTAKASGGLQTPEERALALLVTHPDWSDKEIAAAVGVSRTTVYDWARFKQARRAMRTSADIPKGTKDGNTGDIEAFDDE